MQLVTSPEWAILNTSLSHFFHKAREARKVCTPCPQLYLQYSESQVSTSWGQESGSADGYIYIQWNPGICTSTACSTVPAVRHWSDPWYLWKNKNKNKNKNHTGKGGAFYCGRNTSSLNMCIFRLKAIQHCHNRRSFLFLSWRNKTLDKGREIR